MQRAYWTLKQNLDKFKYNQVIKLNHLGHVKWHRRCKSLTFSKQKVFFSFFFFFFFFCRFLRKKVQGRYILAGTSCNRKPTYILLA